MKKIFIFLFSFLVVQAAFSQSQMAMNTDAANVARKADKELNTIYQKILKQYNSDKIFVKNLKELQRIWILFRDAEMKMKFPEREAGYYGSAYPMCFSYYLAKLTEARIKTLGQWLNGTEGDVCNGSVMPKP